MQCNYVSLKKSRRCGSYETMCIVCDSLALEHDPITGYMTRLWVDEYLTKSDPPLHAIGYAIVRFAVFYSMTYCHIHAKSFAFQ